MKWRIFLENFHSLLRVLSDMSCHIYMELDTRVITQHRSTDNRWFHLIISTWDAWLVIESDWPVTFQRGLNELQGGWEVLWNLHVMRKSWAAKNDSWLYHFVNHKMKVAEQIWNFFRDQIFIFIFYIFKTLLLMADKIWSQSPLTEFQAWLCVVENRNLNLF